MEERGSAYAKNHNPDQDDNVDEIINGGREKSSTLYCKRKDIETTLDDF